MGTPAVSFRLASRIMGAMPQLPDALAEIRGLRSEVEALQREIEKLKSRS
jgi:prefoldin subunit 5